jgi:hypothetical protein
MLIIADNRIPGKAKERLSAMGSFIGLTTSGLTYPAISGHPDIFFCRVGQSLVVAPGLPEVYYSALEENRVDFKKGIRAPGSRHPGPVHYNAASDDHFLVHRLELTDPVILESAHYLKKIAVKQGYTRCNLLLLKDNHFITSDQGIHQAMLAHGFTGIFVSPENILLPGFSHGFIGGTMGISGDTIFILGNPDLHPEGKRITTLVESLGYRTAGLYDGPLFDGGGILFI